MKKPDNVIKCPGCGCDFFGLEATDDPEQYTVCCYSCGENLVINPDSIHGFNLRRDLGKSLKHLEET
jgi:hypothetical protein